MRTHTNTLTHTHTHTHRLTLPISIPSETGELASRGARHDVATVSSMRTCLLMRITLFGDTAKSNANGWRVRARVLGGMWQRGACCVWEQRCSDMRTATALCCGAAVRCVRGCAPSHTDQDSMRACAFCFVSMCSRHFVHMCVRADGLEFGAPYSDTNAYIAATTIHTATTYTH